MVVASNIIFIGVRGKGMVIFTNNSGAKFLTCTELSNFLVYMDSIFHGNSISIDDKFEMSSYLDAIGCELKSQDSMLISGEKISETCVDIDYGAFYARLTKDSLNVINRPTPFQGMQFAVAQEFSQNIQKVFEASRTLTIMDKLIVQFRR